VQTAIKNGSRIADEKKSLITITAPRINIASINIVGTAPYVQNKFSTKAQEQIRATQEAGQQAKSKRKREPKNFKGAYEAALYVSREGWHGIPAPAFRNAMIDACRMVGFKMTVAKMSVFILPDGFDRECGTPLVRIHGKPQYHEAPVRLENGSVDIRARPMFLDGWTATVHIQFDEDQFSIMDVSNLLLRAGIQVGIGEGRPFSKNSCGQGWGTFTIEQK